MIYFLGAMPPPGTKSTRPHSLPHRHPQWRDTDLESTLIVPCRYCGGFAAETVEEQVVIGASEIFRRRYSTCELCTKLRRNGLGLDPTWSAGDARPRRVSQATVKVGLGPTV